ncbi:MAG: hypothetical protein IJX74_04370 [Clostridia bacterium]|nr:hypothetical protein [Clostridia bacterium]
MDGEKLGGGGIITSSTVKILACIFMAIDHIGLCIFPDVPIFRVIGRIAFPLFAFFIAEGCRYTRKKGKRFLVLLLIGLAYFAFYYFYSGVVYANVFLTFSVSVLMIYLLQFCKKKVFEKLTVWRTVGFTLVYLSALAAAYALFRFVSFDYGFKGMLLPVFASLFDFKDISVPKALSHLDNKYARLACFAVGLLLLSLNANFGYWQFFCFLSLIPLLLYNGKAGNKRLKYVFYVFYPAHLLIIEGVAMLIKIL